MLNTNAKIEEALREIAPDQLAVIREMAENRGLDPAALTPNLYRELIREEADYSLVTDTGPGSALTRLERQASQNYTDALNELANRIQG